jgi:hypothetical protein
VSLGSILEIALRKSQFTSASPAHARRSRSFALVVSAAASEHHRRGVTPRRTDAQGGAQAVMRKVAAKTRPDLQKLTCRHPVQPCAPCKLPHPTLTYIRQPTL